MPISMYSSQMCYVRHCIRILVRLNPYHEVPVLRIYPRQSRRFTREQRGRLQKFDRQKILSGLLRACEKRPVSAAKLEKIVDETETYVVDSPERERTTSEVGELIMSHLKEIDTVAYIRFASVYRDFKDVREFKQELEELLSGKDLKKRR